MLTEVVVNVAPGDFEMVTYYSLQSAKDLQEKQAPTNFYWRSDMNHRLGHGPFKTLEEAETHYCTFIRAKNANLSNMGYYSPPTNPIPPPKNNVIHVDFLSKKRR